MRRKIRLMSDAVKTKCCKHGIILIYHRVADLSSDPQLLGVSPKHFEQQMDYLSENYHPVSLVDLLKLLENPGKMPDRCVAVTFDDGYADNLWFAKPILIKYHIPSTVFITTSMIGSDREFWWDDLERIILIPADLPDTLNLKIGKKNYHWLLTEDNEKTNSQNNPEKCKSPYRLSWDVTTGPLPTRRHQVYCDLHRLLYPLDSGDRDGILRQLCSWADVPETGRRDYRALSLEGISDLVGEGLIDIGSHGQTHPLLKTQSPAVQEKEIIESKQILQKILNRAISSFSYPFGDRGDFSPQTVRMVENAGYNLACASFPGHVTIRSNHYSLPRYLVRNWDKNLFALNLSKWQNG